MYTKHNKTFNKSFMTLMKNSSNVHIEVSQLSDVIVPHNPNNFAVVIDNSQCSQ